MTAQSSKGIWEKIEGIKSLKHELTLRLGLLRQARQTEHVEMLVGLSRLDDELENAYLEVRQCRTGTREEEVCLTRIRELEDQRFQLQSVMNGDRLSEYNAVSPR